MADNLAEKVAIPALATTAYTAKQVKKRKTELSKRESKRESDSKRNCTRVNIGQAFQRWRELRGCIGLNFDSELAVRLLERFDADPAKNDLFRRTDNINEDVCVNIGCLLQLFQKCGKCRGLCVVTTERIHTRHISVCQWCSKCNHSATWNSQPTSLPQDILPDSAATSSVVCEEKAKSIAELEVTVEYDSPSPDSMCSGEGEIIQEDFDSVEVEKQSNNENQEVYTQSNEEDDDDDDDDRGVLEAGLNIGNPVEQYLQREKKVSVAEQDTFKLRVEEEQNVLREAEEDAARMEGCKSQEENDLQEKEQEDEDWCMDDEELETDDDSQEESDSDYEIQRKCSKPRKQSTGVRKLRKLTSMQLCPNCGVTYFTQTHTCRLDYVFSCSDCGRYFQSESSVTTHKLGCNGKAGYYRCVYCFEEFNTWLDKKQHEQSHSQTEKPYCCSECPQRFDDHFTRRRHFKEHHTTFVCQTCHKEFTRRCALKRHALSHKDVKPFKCQVCGRAFTQGSQLSSHLRVHTGERPYKCPLCPMSFNHNVSKKNHMRSHDKN